MAFLSFLAIFCACAINVPSANGHGNMVYPITWFDSMTWIWTPDGYKKDYLGMKRGMQCAQGHSLSVEQVCPDASQCGKLTPCPGCACLWYTNWTFIEKPTLFNPKLRTWMKSKNQNQILHHPWRAPGFARIESPCGVSGGNYKGCVGGCNITQGGYAGGVKAERMDFGHEFKVTNWTRGSVVEVAWGIQANHGGGYSYRLCEVPEQGLIGLTEECFQQTPLDFVGNVQWVQYGEDQSTRIEFPATRVNQGTFPSNSQWTKNPIPACVGDGGYTELKPGCSKGTQFPPHRPDLCGFGGSIKANIGHFQFSIVDKVFVPKNLEPGKYVLSFRWDCEQTPQVWNTCSSIEIL